MDKLKTALRHGWVNTAISRGTTPESPNGARILIVGGGYVGMYTALRLQRKLKAELKRGDVEIVVVTPDPYMTYQPFLPEAAAGNISPRHVVVPLRRVLDQCKIVIGEAQSIDHAKRTATLTTLATQEEGAEPEQISYDQLVLAPGSVSRVLPVPAPPTTASASRPSKRPSACATTSSSRWTSPPRPATPRSATRP